MTIRTRLVVATFLLQVLSTALLGWGVLAVRRQFMERERVKSAQIVESAVQRAAMDSLIQKDDVALLSAMKFLRGQYPALEQAKIVWSNSGRHREASVGMSEHGNDDRLSRIGASDPADPHRSVQVELTLDYGVLDQPFLAANRQLAKIILAVWGFSSLFGLLVSYWLARSMTRPITELGRLAEEIGAGRLGARLEWVSDDELGSLVRVFNSMSTRLEEFDKVKRDFVSSVTHELRSPLGAIESFLQLIRDRLAKDGPAGLPQSQEYLARIDVNVKRLSGFINDLLDVAKIEKGKMECVLHPIDLAPVARDVCQFFEAKALQQGVSLSASIDGLPQVMGDADRLRQVLVNLVANGLKFTSAGGKVWIAAQARREGGSRWVEVTVGDSGRGMSEADRARLFQPFSQGRNVAEGVSGHKGTGLGLYIVKSIIEQHGGRVEAASSPGRGTRIVFSVKVAA